jgi:hypothetical protein
MKLNKILFYLSVFLAACAVLLYVVNVYHYDIPFDNKGNIGLLLTFVAMVLLSVSQFLEWKRKQELNSSN